MGRQTFVLGNGLVLSVLDSQSLGAEFDARTEVILKVSFLPHLCPQSNSTIIMKSTKVQTLSAVTCVLQQTAQIMQAILI